jgi:hypothetical protein
MPATNPRISVTVVPSVDAVLSRLSGLTGQSKSSFIAEILESSMPVLERMAVVLDAAQTAKDTLKSQTVRDMEAAETRLQEMLGITMDIFDQTSAPILEEAERIKRRKAGATVGDARERAPAGGPALPPHVTRGSGTPNMSKCTCTTTAKERMEDPSCPVHMPPKASKRPSKPRIVKVKG